MPGMNSGLNDNNATLVAAFRAALLHQGIYVLLIFAILAVAWVSAREWLRPARAARFVTPEPAWRPLLRVGFGGDRAHGFELARLGAARGELGRHHMVVPPDSGGCLGGLDPDRHRRMADRRAPGLLVASGRTGQRGLGPGGLGVRRGVRRGLPSPPDLAVRRVLRGAG